MRSNLKLLLSSQDQTCLDKITYVQTRSDMSRQDQTCSDKIRHVQTRLDHVQTKLQRYYLYNNDLKSHKQPLLAGSKATYSLLEGFSKH